MAAVVLEACGKKLRLMQHGLPGIHVLPVLRSSLDMMPSPAFHTMVPASTVQGR